MENVKLEPEDEKLSTADESGGGHDGLSSDSDLSDLEDSANEQIVTAEEMTAANGADVESSAITTTEQANAG